MKLTEKLLTELQRRLKVGNRRGVHLNGIPSNSSYKFDLNRFSHIDNNLPNEFIKSLLSNSNLKFKISWKDNIEELNSLFETDQSQLMRISKSFENLINQTEAIESEKGINTFGFGFPLLVRRDNDKKLTVAPIVIWQLKIKRTKEFNTWEIIRTEEDPVYVNEVLINHLQSELKNVEISNISAEILDDGLLNKKELSIICRNILKKIYGNDSDDLLQFIEKNISNVKSIPDSKSFEKLTSEKSFHPIHYGGLFSIFEIQKQNIINEYSDLMELEGCEIELSDLEDNSFQPISSVQTDPSQQSVLHSLEASRNLLIQGPPGTGKSQTLTAILVNALENHKKTIVVCEKITALEVLEKALKKRGLEKHFVIIRDASKDRRNVVDSVRLRIDGSGYRRYRYTFNKEPLDNLLQKTKKLVDSINGKHKKLDKKIFGQKSWTEIVGNLLFELRGNENINEINIDKTSFEYSTKELNRIIEILNDGEKNYKEFRPFESKSFLNPEIIEGENLFLVEQKIKDSFIGYETLLTEIKKLESDYRTEYFNIRHSEFIKQTNRIVEISNSIKSILEKNKNNIDFFNEIKTEGLIYLFSSYFNKNNKQTLEDQRITKSLLQELLLQHGKSNDIDNIKIETTNNFIKSNLVLLEVSEKIINSAKLNFKVKINDELEDINFLTFETDKYQSEILSKLKNYTVILLDKINFDELISFKLELIDLEEFIIDLEELLSIKEDYFNNEIDIFSIEFKWFQYLNSLSENEKLLINELKVYENWKKVFLTNYLTSLLKINGSVDLPIDETELHELKDSLNTIEREQLKYIREYWYSRQIDATRKFELNNENLSVENLYIKKSGTKHKSLSLRKIVQYDKDLFTDFFPIILTSPDVASNLFKGMNGYFDIVMFDEASQLRIEDNIPALLKGKQIIIAGDEHQMPPSNYFAKIFEGMSDDESESDDTTLRPIIYVEDNYLYCESLLDLGAELNFNKQYLDFHYRSRHPYLIDFSNYAFYNQRLKPLPNNFEYIPIKYIQVDGTYSESTNETEAEMILSIIDKNINRLPSGKYPTVGIATFNIHQRNLIKGKILERQKFSKFKDFNDKIEELESDGMFIKNLENIQGDERDVIIISTTYGINKEGKFNQRFGSINQSKGYKLLNVIITRAKFKVYLCTSIPEQIFLNYKEYLIVEGSNNKRGVFFAYLAYCKAVSENNPELRNAILLNLSDNSNSTKDFNAFLGGDLESPFEEEVYQSLVDNLGSENLIPQFQFAGFRIDIVYDPKIIGVPKIAIECDGAKYHSSDEAYLYDLHRQKILESNGFVFHRIWSTNWWRNPSRETSKLINFIKNIESEIVVEIEDHSRIASAFTDNIEKIENSVLHSSFIDSDNDLETLKTIEIDIEIEIPKEIDFEVVKLGSKVKIIYLNNEKEINVHLVDNEGNRNEIINGFQKIYFKSPLAFSLIGHKIGDIVKIGDLDNYVEIIDVKN